MQEEFEEPLFHTYSMRLNSSVNDFERGTRAGHSWSDGSKLHLQFFENENRITGTATYSMEEDTWTVTTTKALVAPESAYCEAYYFVNPAAALSTMVSMNLETIIYGDKKGSYNFEEDDAISVTASLSPLTGRIRFVGTPDANYIVSGLSTYTNYNVSANSFTSSARKLSVAIGEDGSSDYYYALFENESQLVVNGEGKSAYLRTFADYVLSAGSSGFVTLPSNEDLGAWTLVNVDNLQEITLPEISNVTMSTIRSKSAGVSAKVTALGNGTLLECGILCSTNTNPTLGDGTLHDGATSKEISLRIKSLQPETYYYVRAYARNERGIAWSDITSFKTISEEEEEKSVILREDFITEDDDLNVDFSSGGTIDKNGFNEDDDLNVNSSSGATVDKNGFDEDDDLNVNSSGGATVGKNGFDEDDDLNVNSSGGATVDKNGFDEDDDLNTSATTNGSSLNKSGFPEDESWN